MELTIQERSFIYRWFNYLLERELSEEQLQTLQAERFEPFFAFMTELGFADQVAKFRFELTACLRLDVPHLELAADYAQLFLLDGQQSALPYASAYLNDIELADQLNAMDRLLAQSDLAINRAKNEPSDHLCVHLALLIYLIDQESTQQHTFIAERLLNWLPQLSEKVVKITTQTRFYQVLLAWLMAVLQSDIQA
ncbi:molecular chaperone TorD [Actinobacillus minor]|uniref:molecular chaperone TorD n=1 Tax=Actinobacillus minor TaxID=51047 RepID=UPI0026E9B3B9|nr:molecular chaperone TorD [Actinobacillus minor]